MERARARARAIRETKGEFKRRVRRGENHAYLASHSLRSRRPHVRSATRQRGEPRALGAVHGLSPRHGRVFLSLSLSLLFFSVRTSRVRGRNEEETATAAASYTISRRYTRYTRH